MAQLLQSSLDSNRCRVCPTRTVCIAADAWPDQIDRLPEFIQCLHAIAPGKHLYQAGDAAVAQYYVRSGMVKTYTINSQGYEYVTGFYQPGEIFGHVHLNGCHAEFAVALETASICKLDDNGFQSCAELGMSSVLFKHLAANAYIDLCHQINLKQTSARSRFAGFCVTMSARLARLGRNPARIPTPMSRTDIASYLGMTQESLSRIIATLHAANVIYATREHIDVLQTETLSTLGLHVSP
jgi:CRP/FNR family transcriptional regulator, anaerobic regulatory protein